MLLKALKPEIALQNKFVSLTLSVMLSIEYMKTVNAMTCQQDIVTMYHGNSVLCNIAVDICILRSRLI